MRRVPLFLISVALLLLVAVAWFGCQPDALACDPDAYEPNDSVGSAVILNAVEEDEPEQSWTATISASSDRDFFGISAEEGSDVCFPGSEESCALRVRLVPPQGAGCRDYDLHLYDDTGVLISSSTEGGCAEESILFTWAGTCALDDSRSFIVEVRPSPGEFSCSAYTLYASMWEQ